MADNPFLAIPALIGTLVGAGVAAGSMPVPRPAPGISAPAAVPTAAQGIAHHRNRGGAMTRALRSLNLSTQQKGEIRAARQRYRDSRTTAAPESRAQLRAQIRALLTPQQRSQFDAMMLRQRRAPMSIPSSAAP